MASGTRRPVLGMPRASMTVNQAGVEKKSFSWAKVWRAVSSCVFGVVMSARGLG